MLLDEKSLVVVLNPDDYIDFQSTLKDMVLIFLQSRIHSTRFNH